MIVAQNTTSSNRPGLKLVESGTLAEVKRDLIINPVDQEIKSDVQTLESLCLEIAHFFHAEIGVSLSSLLFNDNRGQQ